MSFISDLYSKALAGAKDYYAREPARTNAYVTSGVIAVAGALGIVLTSVAVLPLVAVTVPLVLAALLQGDKTRARVRPVKKA